MSNILAPETEEALGYLMVHLMTPNDVLQDSVTERDFPGTTITTKAKFIEAEESWSVPQREEFELSLEWMTNEPLRKLKVTSRYGIVDGVPQLVPGKYKIEVMNTRFGYTERLDDHIAEALRKPMVVGKPTLRTADEVNIAALTMTDYYNGTMLSVMRIFTFFQFGMKEKFES